MSKKSITNEVYKKLFSDALNEFSMMQKLKSKKDKFLNKHQGDTFTLFAKHKKTGQSLYIDKYDGKLFVYDKDSDAYMELPSKLGSKSIPYYPEMKDYKRV